MTPPTANHIPPKTIERLSEYRRLLSTCMEKGITHLFSHEIADMYGSTAVQVRRDLMLGGFSSDTKKGYDVKLMINYIDDLLYTDATVNVVVIGMGRVGHAMTGFFNEKHPRHMRIVATFDVDKEKVGQKIDHVQCYHIDELREVVKRKKATVAILSVPTKIAPSMVEPIVQAGVKGVINFTSVPLLFPDNIVSEHYDIMMILEKVIYFIKEQEENAQNE